jgi:sec-independent protein translocase protein TatC
LPEARARSADAFTRLAHASSLVPSDRRSALSGARSLSAASRSLARPDARTPVTLGLGEPFSTSITVALALALLLGLPFLLAQAWAFVTPAIAPAERRAVRPLLILAPALFGAGTAFGYFVVLPRAVGFLQGFTHGAFDVLVQARLLLRFASTTENPQPRPLWPRSQSPMLGRRVIESPRAERRGGGARRRILG